MLILLRERVYFGRNVLFYMYLKNNIKIHLSSFSNSSELHKANFNTSLVI